MQDREINEVFDKAYSQMGKEYRKKFPVWEWSDTLENFYLSRIIEKYRPETVVDAGCGPCNKLYLLKEKVKFIVGFDYSEMGLKICKDFTPLVFRGSITDIPLKTSHFDMVYSIQVISLLPSWEHIEKSFKECARILKTGGICVTVDYRLGGFLKKKFDPVKTENYSIPRWGFTKEDYIKLARISGLELIKVGTIFNFKPRLIKRFPPIQHLWMALDYLAFNFGFMKGLYLLGIFKKTNKAMLP